MTPWRTDNQAMQGDDFQEAVVYDNSVVRLGARGEGRYSAPGFVEPNET